MRVPVAVLVLLFCSGCLISGGPGRDEYVPYDIEELLEDPGSHRSEWVEVIGTIIEDECGFGIEGTGIGLSGELDDYIGQGGVIRGVFQTRISDIDCGALRIDVQEFEPQGFELVTS